VAGGFLNKMEAYNMKIKKPSFSRDNTSSFGVFQVTSLGMNQQIHHFVVKNYLCVFVL
jgi:hypothetical protein